MLTHQTYRFFHASRQLLLALFLGCLLTSPAFAQDEPPPPAERGYSTQSVMAIFMIALGTFAVCRSSLRHVKSEE